MRETDWIDPEAVLRIDSLELRARIVVEGFLSGLHRSPYHGFSVEFSEYRPYSSGDDLRYLDWKLLARTDRRYVKRFEDETNLRCHLVLDLSRSMAFGEGRRSKFEYAVTLAATLARFLATQRDAVGLLTFDAGVHDYVPARYSPGHLARILGALERGATGTNTDLVASLQRVAGFMHKRGVVVLFSDLLAPLEGLDRALAQLRARGQEVIVFRVLDPAEVEFPFEKAAMFEDLESGKSFYVDPVHATSAYRERFQAHADALTRLAADHGVDLVPWTTDRPLMDCLYEYLQARGRRGRVVRRRTAWGARG
ncbi:MAG: DUF58 domain-containing protein [bacterium]|nr:DUF58 domain-containing protein [bacterium]